MKKNTNNNPYDKITVFDTTYFDKNGKSLANSTLETHGNEQNSTFATNSFKYAGSGHIYTKDIKYTKIYGSNSYAIDLNNNGIVDRGEIKKY